MNNCGKCTRMAGALLSSKAEVARLARMLANASPASYERRRATLLPQIERAKETVRMQVETIAQHEQHHDAEAA